MIIRCPNKCSPDFIEVTRQTQCRMRNGKRVKRERNIFHCVVCGERWEGNWFDVVCLGDDGYDSTKT